MGTLAEGVGMHMGLQSAVGMHELYIVLLRGKKGYAERGQRTLLQCRQMQTEL
jgi:hypothetical protein